MFRGRASLCWLLVVPVLYVGALPLVNRVEPVVLGLPFLAVWLLGATLLTPVAVWLAARGDPVWRSGGAAPVDTGTGPGNGSHTGPGNGSHTGPGTGPGGDGPGAGTAGDLR